MIKIDTLVKILLIIIPVLAFIPLTDDKPNGMPHGDNFSYDCELCHSTEEWQVKSDSMGFNHNETGLSVVKYVICQMPPHGIKQFISIVYLFRCKCIYRWRTGRGNCNRRQISSGKKWKNNRRDRGCLYCKTFCILQDP